MGDDNGMIDEPLDTTHARTFAAQARELRDPAVLADVIDEMAYWVEAMADEIDRLRGVKPDGDRGSG